MNSGKKSLNIKCLDQKLRRKRFFGQIQKGSDIRRQTLASTTSSIKNSQVQTFTEADQQHREINRFKLVPDKGHFKRKPHKRAIFPHTQTRDGSGWSFMRNQDEMTSTPTAGDEGVPSADEKAKRKKVHHQSLRNDGINKLGEPCVAYLAESSTKIEKGGSDVVVTRVPLHEFGKVQGQHQMTVPGKKSLSTKCLDQK